MNTVNKGNLFEEEVADLYRALGYRVEKDILISQKQTDILCKLNVKGAPPIKIYVDSKDFSKPVSTATVRQFVVDFKSLSDKYGITCGVLITRHGINRNAKCFLKDFPNIRALTYQELFFELLNVQISMKQFVVSYESQDISLMYLPIKGKCDLDHSIEKPIMESIIEWLGNDEQQMFILLGDFGTGKTTLLERIKYEYAKKFSGMHFDMIPLLFPLRKFEASGTIESFVESQIRVELDVNISYEKFIYYLSSGHFLLLVDGFDEMGKQVDNKKRMEYFLKILPLLAMSKKSILTCRPAYFITDQEMKQTLNKYYEFFIQTIKKPMSKNLESKHNDFVKSVNLWKISDANLPRYFGDYSIYYLSSFTKADVDEYVRRFLQNKSNAFDEQNFDLRKRIEQTYDLEDLSRRPILLNLIVRTLPNIPIGVEASPSVIYREYTNAWLSHDYAKGSFRQLIDSNKKKEFMTILAWNMYTKSILEMSYSDLKPHLSEFFRVDHQTLNYFFTDIQACSFLERDGEGNFRFSHKSFMEYFCAEFIYEKFLNNDFEKYIFKPVSDEICFFLGDILFDRPKTLDIFRKITIQRFRKGTQSIHKDLESNLLRIFSKSRSSLYKLNVFRRKISNIHFYKNRIEAKFSSSILNNITFETCSLYKGQFENCIFQNLIVINCSFKYSTFSNINLESNAIMRNTTLTIYDDYKIKLDHCRLSLVNFENFCNINIVDSVLKDIKICHLSGLIEIIFSRIDGGFSSIGALLINNCKMKSFTFSPLGGHLHNKNPVPLIRKYWKKNNSFNFLKHNFIKTKISNCLFLWWDFCEMTFQEVEFKNCWFIGARFKDRNQIAMFSNYCDKDCKFVVTCKQITDIDEIEAIKARAEQSVEREAKRNAELNGWDNKEKARFKKNRLKNLNINIPKFNIVHDRKLLDAMTIAYQGKIPPSNKGDFRLDIQSSGAVPHPSHLRLFMSISSVNDLQTN